MWMVSKKKVDPQRFSPEQANRLASFVASNISLKTNFILVDGRKFDASNINLMGWALHLHNTADKDSRHNHDDTALVDVLTTEGTLYEVRFIRGSIVTTENELPNLVFTKNLQGTTTSWYERLPDAHKTENCILKGIGNLAIKSGLIAKPKPNIK